MPTLFQINIVANWGSTGKIAEQIGSLAQSNGWQSYMAYGRSKNPSKQYLIQIGSKWDVYYHALYTKLTDRHGLASKSATKRLVEQIKQIKPDIIHLHNIHGYYLNYQILFEYLNSTDIPIVWTLHDCWSFTGHCAHFTSISCEKWKNQCEKCPLKRSYPGSLFIDNSKENYLLKKSLFSRSKNITLVSVSKWLNGLVQQSFLQDCSKRVIYNGIDTTVFSIKNTVVNTRNKYKIPSKYVLLAVASVWNERKGLSDYISLSKKLNDHYIIVLVGLSKKQIDLLPANMMGIERTQNMNELADLYNTADVVLNLSYQETFGLTTVEGFACGTPGIVYNTTASPELVSDGAGIIIEPGDLDGVYKAVLTICKNGKSAYSTVCRKRAEEYFDMNKQYAKYIELYNEILDNKNKQHNNVNL